MNLEFNIDLADFFLFAILILPGFISMRVYSLIRPGDQPTLKDTIFEAIAYSAINIGLMSWAIFLFFSTEAWHTRSLLAALILAVGPVIWPFLLDRFLGVMAKTGLVKYRYKTAWDDFFSRRQACWLIVHLHDGTKIGGIFSGQSYATLYPTPGHLFIEELWEVDQNTGAFKGEEPVSNGIILKPEDYRFVEIKAYISEQD
ncbi:MAG: DUF6338 family protein [Hoeflea sp.]|uniref:DUF6338 family protein n=1 Tax=Hoeflea sp. TaxID=1940281 RepID=UPI0032977BC9